MQAFLMGQKALNLKSVQTGMLMSMLRGAIWTLTAAVLTKVTVFA